MTDTSHLDDIAVVIVDDDRDLAAMMRRYLEHHRYRVTTVSDPRSALDRCLDVRPKIVIVDLMMPHLDGEDLVRQLRGVLQAETPPIVLATASAVRTEVQKRLGLPASLSKPFAMSDLLDVVVRFAGEPR